jgi:RNA polymerase sigma-70 factor, ECF subfamily
MEENIDIHIKGCLANNPRSQELLYKYCFMNLMKVSFRYHTNEADAAASFNKAMHTVFDKLKMYRGDGPFLGWVRTIVVNTCLNELRKVVKYPVKEVNEDELKLNNTLPEVYSNISEKEIMALVQTLPDATRLVFNLYVMECYTHIKIAEVLKISAGTSKWQLNQARTILKEKITMLQINENIIHAK